MSYKFISKTTGYFPVFSKNFVSRMYLNNENIERNSGLENLRFGFQHNRYLHTSVFVRCLTDKQDIKPQSVNLIDKKDLNISATNIISETKEKEIAKKSLWEKIKAEIIHYYHGFKLLFLDIKVAAGILIMLTKGHTLTRRERKQLVRTSADIARMLPFLIFIIVPFMELLLPLYLKFFPFMLPSTFNEESKDKEFTMQKLKGKLEIAKFLQEAIAESAAIKKITKKDGIDMSTFSDFLKQVRESGLTVNTDDIVRFSHLFEDEITLESLHPKYLKALCKLLDINTIGPSALLRFQLEMKVRQLKVDDKMISNEGMDKVPVWELQQLCRERGMRSIGVSEARLRYQLSQWLSLHLEKNIPTTLLLLTRVMYLPETLTPEEQLKQAILVLPKAVSNTAKLKVADTEKRVDNKTKFEVIKEEQQVIVNERKEAAKAIKEAVVISPDKIIEPQPPTEDKAPIIDMKPVDPDIAPIIKLPEVALDKETFDETKAIIAKVSDNITAEDLTEIQSAILNIEDTKTIFHKEELNVLKDSREEISKVLVSPDMDAPIVPKEGKVVQRLTTKLDKMINEMEKVVEIMDTEVNKSQETVEKDQPIIEKEPEILSSSPKPKSIQYVNKKDVLINLKSLQKTPEDSTKWETILDILDEDNDGQIEMDHLLKVIKILSAGEIKLSSTEISKLLEIIDKEALISESDKSKK